MTGINGNHICSDGAPPPQRSPHHRPQECSTTQLLAPQPALGRLPAVWVYRMHPGTTLRLVPQLTPELLLRNGCMPGLADQRVSLDPSRPGAFPARARAESSAGPPQPHGDTGRNFGRDSPGDEASDRPIPQSPSRCIPMTESCCDSAGIKLLAGWVGATGL